MVVSHPLGLQGISVLLFKVFLFKCLFVFQVGHDEEKPTRGQHYIRAGQPSLYPTSHYPVVETPNSPAYRLPPSANSPNGFTNIHGPAIYAGQGQPV